MSGLQAARQADEIGHSLGLVGMAGGVILGAVAGAALIGLAVATGGGALVVAMAVAGAGMAIGGGGLAGGQLLHGIETASAWMPTTGTLASGSPNVRIGALPASRTVEDRAATCDGLLWFYHISTPSVRIAEGAKTVLINRQHAARVHMKLECGALIKEGEPTVLIGGPTARVLPVQDLEGEFKAFLEGLFWTSFGALAVLTFANGGWVALLELGVEFAVCAMVFDALGTIGDAIGPGWSDILQGTFGVGLTAGPLFKGRAREPSKQSEPTGGEQAEPTGGEQAEPTGGEQAEPTGGEQAEPTGGEQAEPTGGEQAEPTGGEQAEPTGGEQAEPTGGEQAEPTGGEQAEPTGGNEKPAGDGENARAEGEKPAGDGEETASQGESPAEDAKPLGEDGKPADNDGRPLEEQKPPEQNKSSEGEHPPDASDVSPTLEQKILFGEQKPSSLKEIRGAHSPEIKNDPSFQVEEIKQNQDGTTVVKLRKQLPNGNWSKPKKSTLAPDTWSNEKILEATKQVADTPPVETAPDGRTMHRQTIDGVQWEVIKDGDGNITSSYPTGGTPSNL